MNRFLLKLRDWSFRLAIVALSAACVFSIGFFLGCRLNFFSTLYSLFIYFSFCGITLAGKFTFASAVYIYTHIYHFPSTNFKPFISKPASINECILQLTKRVSSVVIVTSYRMVQTNFSPLRRVQTKCGAHLASYSMRARCISRRGSPPGRNVITLIVHLIHFYCYKSI